MSEEAKEPELIWRRGPWWFQSWQASVHWSWYWDSRNEQQELDKDLWVCCL